MKEDPKFKPFPNPYSDKIAKDGMDFEVSKAPMEVGFDKKDKPLESKDGPIALS